MVEVPGMHIAAQRLAKARHCMVLTGAGISAESGIRTFRDTMEGLWKDFDPAALATQEGFDADPALVTRWYDWRRLGCAQAQPNPGHLALTQIETALLGRGNAFDLFTQNVDGLHQRAGSQHVHEVHGSIARWRCTKTGRELDPGPEAFTEFPPPSPWGGLLRPGVVWFGEMLPQEVLDRAEEVLDACDVFLSIGTSSQVYPAAGFMELAAVRGAFVIEVNPTETALTRTAEISLRGKAGEIMPRLAEAAFGPAR